MTSIEEHLHTARRLVGELPIERVASAEAAGRVLTEDVRAIIDSPPFTNSQMDGYALDATSAGTFPVGPTIPAGTDADLIYPDGLQGQAAPVMTGAMLPRGTVAVVPVERCDPPEFLDQGARVSVPGSPHGEFVRPAGSDIAQGDLLLSRGTTITPAGVATLVGQGVADVEVRARARILVVTGGAEVGGTGAAAIPDSNAPLIAALAARHGIDIAGFLRTDDDPVRLKEELEGAVDKHHPTAVVTSGGISAGKFEVIRQVLEPTGWFGHVDQQPGGPQGLSTFHGTPVFSLPGNPISTLVSFRMFVAPVLGHAPEPVTALLSEARTGIARREQLLRGNLTAEDGRLRATPVGGTSSHLIAQGATADCLIRIPADTVVSEGSPVTVYPF